MSCAWTCSAPEAAAYAADLLGQPVVEVLPVRRGGNNALFRITTAGRDCFALKVYPRQSRDNRDRLGREYAFLQFLQSRGVTAVPRPRGADRQRDCALYDWIDGQPVTHPGPEELEALVAFLEQLHPLARHPEAAALAEASDCCLSPATAGAQLQRRLARLAEIAPREPALERFLEREFRPLALAVLEHLAAQPGFAALLAPERRTLSPSDFGFHNALRRPSGELVFLDFEYAGWDDPVKLVADVCWHPGMDLAPELVQRFRSRTLALYRAGDDDFPQRLASLLPLFGLIWCLILLNEFLPERWQRRTLGHADGTERAAVLNRQLGRAQARIERLRESWAVG
ncbi:MAG: aminoglycoside phosphotransferase family protein [Magnetococcales bacterium]|nr:aminoglycoside phosphotransferase family protein [Magnetococcales bacterium]